jgi:porin
MIIGGVQPEAASMDALWLAPMIVATSVAIGASAPAAAEEDTPVPPAMGKSFLDRPTLTDDWFGQGPALRDAGLDLRFDWSQFYQGLAEGDGPNGWEYGGELDALMRLDLSKMGLWEGLSVTAQGNLNYGENANGLGGALIPVNTALAFPGDTGSDRSDLMALFLTQRFGDLASVSVGKINMIEVARVTPLKGGGGVDTFWNVGLAAPITGLVPATIFGAMATVNTRPVRFTFFVYDPTDATNCNPFDDPFEKGVSTMGVATLMTSIGGRTGFYGIRGIYSTKEGLDLRDVEDLLLPPGAQDINTEQGSYYASLQMQQYLIQDPNDPRIGRGIFGEIGISDGNPNPLEWSGYVGIGGTSFIPGREEDRFGIAYFKYGLSEHLKEGLAPIVNLDDESGLEVFYNWAATPWLHVTGDIQFIDPGLGDFPREVVAGISTRVRF